MTSSNSFRRLLFTSLLFGFVLNLVCLGAIPVSAQEVEEAPPFGGLTDFGLNQDPLGIPGMEKLTFISEFTVEEGTRTGELKVTAIIAPEHYIYSMTQPAKGGTPTSIIIKSDEAKINGRWRAEKKPKNEVQKIGDDEYVMEKHMETITWVVPIRLQEDVDPRDVEIEVTIDGQICKETCAPFTKEVEADFDKYTDKSVTDFRSGHVSWAGTLQPKNAKPGDTVTLSLIGTPDFEYHLYPYSDTPTKGGNQPTMVYFSNTNDWEISGPTVEPEPVLKKDLSGQMSPMHPLETTWSYEIKIPEGTPPGNYNFQGLIAFQVCNESACDVPSSAKFRIPLVVGDVTKNESVAALLTKGGGYSKVENAIVTSPSILNASAAGGTADTSASGSLDLGNLNVQGSGAEQYSLPIILLFALLGGFILNFMPCVLPVIGLKVLSFVQQAGSDRKTAFMLNLWYSAGLLSIFMVMAVLVAFFNQGWGQQSQSVYYQVTMSAIIFVMGLSFLGVWEIPIPGFVGSGKAAEKAEQEGALAAFIKGIITTILAIPCSGPGIALALTWCVGKPPYLVILVFFFMGLGMALPYIVIGLNPGLVKFLPKPGLWMEKFKQIMGFFLLATVIWLLSTMKTQLVLPTVAFLFGLWVSCWMIGQISLSANKFQRMRSWLIAGVVGAVFGWLTLGLLGNMMQQRHNDMIRREIAQSGGEMQDVAHSDNPNHLNWQPFTFKRLEDEIAAGNTVMIDFTADW